MSITNKLKKRKIKVKKKKSYNSYKFDYKKSFFFNIYLRSIFYFKIYTYIKKCLFNNKKNLRYLKRWFFVKLLRIFFATTPHNFFMSLHKINGDILFYTSSGMHGFKSKRKLNHSAANELGRFLVLQFKKKKKRYFLFLYFSGLNRFRFSILKGLRLKRHRWFFKVKFFFDLCFLPHNGLTLTKKRRKKRRNRKNSYSYNKIKNFDVIKKSISLSTLLS